MKQIFIYFLLLTGIAFSESDNIELTAKSDVLVYSNYFWAPCDEAKTLLQSRGIDYIEKKITFSRKGTAELSKLSGGNTYTPQLIVDGKYFGGLKKLKAYFAELDK